MSFRIGLWKVNFIKFCFGGAVILAVGRVTFVSCATPRGTGTNLNDSDAAA